MKSSSSKISASRSRNLLGILSFLKRYPRATTVAIGLVVFNNAVEMLLPRVSGAAISQLQGPTTKGVPMHPWHLAGIYLGLALLGSAGAFIAGRVRNLLIQGTLRDIRAAYFDAVQRLSFAYHDETNTGELISRGTADISRLQDFFFACLFLSIDISVTMIVSVILIGTYSIAAAVGTFLVLVPTVGLLAYFAKQLHPRWRKVHDLHGEMTTTIQENIAGVRVVKAFARETGEIAKFREKRDAFMAGGLEAVGYWARRVPAAQFVFGLSMPLVLWIVGRQVIHGTVSVGNLATIVLYLVGIGARMNPIGQLVGTVQTASASSERVMEVLREPQGIRGGTHILAGEGGARVTFTNVGLLYPRGSAPVLEDISFDAKPGETVAIVGATGAGKSSLAHLIPRFYDATTGSVSIDGVNVRELDLRQLRRSVGMIFQETVLFSATVAENVAYGRPEATREQVVAAARAAHAHEFILQLENGYETVIGERGVSLSGGQKQRLAIARAFLLDPRILILDDATSSLDSKTERLIQEDMRRVCLGRTAFVIAHRLTAVQHADQILVIKQGRVAERGTPAELLAEGTLFRELFRDQCGGGSAPETLPGMTA